VAGVILLVAFVVASALRWVVLRGMKGIALDKFLRESGLDSVIARTGRLRAASLVAGALYWVTLGIGFLTALDVFNTTLTSRMVEATVFAIPKILTAAAIVLAGFWVAQYLSRSALLWAVNDGVPYARRIALAVKVAIVFVAVVVAADALDFAERVFLSAFLIFVGSAALAGSIALGWALRSLVERHVNGKSDESADRESSVWNHL
jgi:hypothetical protein